MLEIKNIITEVENAFDGLISRLDTGKKNNSELEDISTENFVQNWKAKTEKSRTEYPRIWDNYKNCNICIMGVPDGEEREEQKKYLKW